MTKDNEVKWYKTTISSKGYISLGFSHDYIDSSNYYWRVRLYDAKQNELAVYDYRGDNTASQSGNIGVPAGTYYVKVEDCVSYGYSGLNYNIKLNFTSNSAWETELNDGCAEADVISTNTTMYGTIREDNDKDWYKVTVSSKGYISLSFSHDHIDSSNYYWRVRLYDAKQNELAVYDYQGNNTTSQSGNIEALPGTYYIKVEDCVSYGYSDLNYNFKLNFSSYNPANQGKWMKDSTGWWYRRGNGTYPVNCWEKLMETGIVLTKQGTVYMVGNQSVESGIIWNLRQGLCKLVGS